MLARSVAKAGKRVCIGVALLAHRDEYVFVNPIVDMDTAAILANPGSGGVIGLILGPVARSGSIVAVLIYVVSVNSPHAAIGTAAVAVTINALASLLGYVRAGRVK